MREDEKMMDCCVQSPSNKDSHTHTTQEREREKIHTPNTERETRNTEEKKKKKKRGETHSTEQLNLSNKTYIFMGSMSHHRIS